MRNITTAKEVLKQLNNQLPTGIKKTLEDLPPDTVLIVNNTINGFDILVAAEKHLPYPENKGQTHFLGCHRTPQHHNCAIHLLDEATELLLSLEHDKTNVCPICTRPVHLPHTPSCRLKNLINRITEVQR